MKSILILGASGLVGSRFRELSRFAPSFLTPDSNELDILSRQDLTAYIKDKNPTVIVNFAAYTNASEGEKQRGEKYSSCWKLNVEAVENLLYSAQTSQTRFIQISTDMVFPGNSENPGPYDEDQTPEENSELVTWYGYSKAEAERLTQTALGDRTTILRLIYPVRAKFAGKLDYLRKPLKLFDEGKLYPLFTDQQISISFIDEIATALDLIIEKNLFGVFHASSRDLTTPYEIVSYLLNKARGRQGVVQKTSLAEFLKTIESPVRYPLFGGLKVEKTEKVLGIRYSSWREIIDSLVSQGLVV